MPWEVKYIEAENIVVIINSGTLNREDFIAEAKRAWQVMQQHQTLLCLVDDRDYHHPPKIIDLYELPKLYDRLGFSRQVRGALLFNPENPVIGDFEFFETVGRNRGYNFKIFYDESEAKRWLKRPRYDKDTFT